MEGRMISEVNRWRGQTGNMDIVRECTREGVQRKQRKGVRRMVLECIWRI